MTRELITDLTVHLVAAVNLLEKYHERMAPTKRDALFGTKIKDYANAAERGRQFMLAHHQADDATLERAVMVCPQCEGEGGYPDGVDEGACHTECTRCGGNGWIVDTAAIAAMREDGRMGEIEHKKDCGFAHSPIKLCDCPPAPDDLVERLLTQADGSRTPSLLKEAAAYIKELKAALVEADRKNEAMLHEWNSAEARATKAEEALREIRDFPCDGFIASARMQGIAKKHLGEEKA